jgi:hypothetical protein
LTGNANLKLRLHLGFVEAWESFPGMRGLELPVDIVFIYMQKYIARLNLTTGTQHTPYWGTKKMDVIC